MFTGNSPYGWGGWRIPMSRSATDIFADRRKKRSGYQGEEQRSGFYIQPFGAIVIECLKRDFPVRRVIAAVSFALASVAGLIMAGWIASLVFQEPAPPPLEIHARLIEDAPLPIVPAVPEKKVSEPVSAPVMSKPEKRILVPPPRELPKTVLPVVKILPPSPARPDPVIKQPVMARNYAMDSNPSVVPLSKVRKTGEREDLPRISQPLAVKQTQGISSSTAGSIPLPGVETFSPRSGVSKIDLPTAAGPGVDVGSAGSKETTELPGKGRRFSPRNSPIREELGNGGPVGSLHQTPTGNGDFSAPLPLAKRPIAGVAAGGADHEVLIPAASTSGLGAVSTRDLSAGTIGPVGSTRFLVDGGSGDLDPNLFVSLNQLGACVDQAREDRLRTELATLLDQEGQCPDGGMIFFLKYPETGWTMQVDIYNPIEFADKCAALSAAIECVQHSKHQIP